MTIALPPTRRDRKKMLTRRALRWAALDLVAERGYVNVTVEDIAEAADVSARTFFNYFSSKEAAVVGGDPELYERLRATLAGRPAGETVVDSLRAVVREQCERFVEDADETGGDAVQWCRKMKAVHSDPHLRAAVMTHIETYERVLVDGIAERLGTDPESDPYPVLLAASAMTASRISIMYWARSGGTGSPAVLAEEAFVGLARGLPLDGQLAAVLADLRGCAAATPPGQRRKG